MSNDLENRVAYLEFIVKELESKIINMKVRLDDHYRANDDNDLKKCDTCKSYLYDDDICYRCGDIFCTSNNCHARCNMCHKIVCWMCFTQCKFCEKPVCQTPPCSTCNMSYERFCVSCSKNDKS